MTEYIGQRPSISNRYMQRYYEWKTIRRDNPKRMTKIQSIISKYGIGSLYILPFWKGPIPKVTRADRELVEEHAILYAKPVGNTALIKDLSMIGKHSKGCR